MKRFLMVLVLVFGLCTVSQAADISFKWDASTGATGYKIYRSVDNGATWTMVKDVGLVTEITLTAQPDTGLVIYRVSAYNTVGESVRHWSGAWYNKSWEPPGQPAGAGIR